MDLRQSSTLLPRQEPICRFSSLYLRQIVEEGLRSGAVAGGVAVVNLNLRSVVAATRDGEPSIFAQLLKALTAPSNWSACQACDLKERCYVYHNAQTFQEPQVGPKVAERLETLYTLVHLRGEKHTTVRLLRSALAFTLAGTRTCDDIHELYARGERAAIVQGFYFNSWMGGDAPTTDPLLAQLKELDVGRVGDPQLDRMLSFTSPIGGNDSRPERLLLTFAERGEYGRSVLRKIFEELPDNSNGGAGRVAAHQAYLALMRRRTYFERRDAAWTQMLPYRSAGHLLALVRNGETFDEVLQNLLHALNRGEGLAKPQLLGARLAIRVRHVEKGTIRSYRLFPAERFTSAIDDAAARARFVEHLPGGLILRYSHMPLTKTDREFRLPKVSYLDFKQLEMDRVLTAFFQRVKHTGYPSRLVRPDAFELTVEDFRAEIFTHPSRFRRFADYPEVTVRWIETHLMDLVNRGKPDQAVAAPRPLHGLTYLFRNPKRSRDYNASQQLYEMLYNARSGGTAALDHLSTFFFYGYDLTVDQEHRGALLDVETQALLNLETLVAPKDIKDDRQPRESYAGRPSR